VAVVRLDAQFLQGLDHLVEEPGGLNLLKFGLRGLGL